MSSAPAAGSPEMSNVVAAAHPGRVVRVGDGPVRRYRRATSASRAMVPAILASGISVVLPTAAHPSNSRNTHTLR